MQFSSVQNCLVSSLIMRSLQLSQLFKLLMENQLILKYSTFLFSDLNKSEY